MSPYRTESRASMYAIRRGKDVETGYAGVADGPEDRVNRAALFGSLPGRVDAGVIDDFGVERLLHAGSTPPFPHFAAKTVLGLFAIGLLALFF